MKLIFFGGVTCQKHKARLELIREKEPSYQMNEILFYLEDLISNLF